jgi:predicted ester cyclase
MAGTANVVAGNLTSEELASIEGFYRAIGGEFDLADEALAPGWRGVRAPGVEVGIDLFKPHLVEFHELFSDVTVTIHQIVAAEGHAAVRAEVAGTNDGEYLGVAPTHTPGIFRMHAFHEFQDGRIFRTWPLDDVYGWMQQVGAV